jgi:hypothetical protein
MSNQLWLLDEQRLEKIAKLKMVIQFLEEETCEKLPAAVIVNLMSQTVHSTMADATDMTVEDISEFGSQIMHGIFSPSKVELGSNNSANNKSNKIEKKDKIKTENDFQF